MAPLEITFLGSGDAFGHGGRLQPCILIKTPRTSFLLDCGASAMISLQRFGVEPKSIETIILSHLHGDHFGGLPFFILDAQLHSKRTLPLTIAGPTGTGKRLEEALELMFPGSSKVQRKFPVEVVELRPEEAWSFSGVTVRPFEVVHASQDPALALRLSCQDRIIAYTGDTEWTEALVPAAQGADLLIAEAYFFQKRIKFHLDYMTLRANLPRLRPKRLILTHLSQDMLARLDQVEAEAARDGLVVTL